MSTKFVAAALAIASAQAAGKVSAPEPEYSASSVRVEVPAIPYCRDGSEYDPAFGCAFVDYAEPRNECPHPYKLDRKNGVCRTTTYGESSRICPKGGYLDGRSCVHEITAPVDVSCKRGVLQKDESCLVVAEPVVVEDRFDDVRFDCADKGFSFDEKTGKCFKEISADAELVCDEGYELRGRNCYTLETVEPECPKGYNRIGKDCLAITIQDPTYSCPRGTTSDGKGGCLETVRGTATQTCEKGYSLDKRGRCEARILVTAVLDDKKKGPVAFDCMGELDKDGNCYQTHTTSAVDVCDAGFTFDKLGRCVMSVPVEPEASCPHFFELSDGECVRTRSRSLSCPRGYSMEDSKDKYPICVRTVSERAAQVCPKGFDATDSKIRVRCTALEVGKPIPYCKKGFELINGACVIPGYVEAGKDKVYSADYSCPKGFKLDKDKMICVDTVKEPAVDVCDKGFTLDNRGRCVADHEVPAQLMCPKNYKHTDKKGALCERVSYDRPLFRCPEGARSIGKSCYINEKDSTVVLATSGKKLR